jgi:small-conductance mechanosensitive channel/CRP-like cAMP-binding protein
MAGVSIPSAGLLILSLVALIALRPRGVATRTGCEILLLALIMAHLVLRGASPIHVLGGAQGSDAAWLRALAVIWWLIAARVVTVLTAWGLGRDARSRHARLFSDILAGGVYLTAIAIILNSVLGLPVRGLLATSGIVAIVVGLALQSTLADVFAGIATGLEQPFRVGDRISISDHAGGVVVEMNWRAIRIQTDDDDLATIPNSVVARSQIVNHSVPSERRSGSIEIPTSSQARTERLNELVRQAILLCPDILADPAPAISLKRIGVRTITLGVSFHVASTPKLGAAKSQLLRQVRRLFRHAGIIEGTPETPSALLHNVTLFENLPAEHIERLAGQTTTHAYVAGEPMMEQGSSGASLYVVRSGIFEIRRAREDGDPIIYGRVGPGEYLGEVSMMSGDPRSVTVVALTPALAMELPREALEALLRDDRSLSDALEASVRRGLCLLERDDAARTSHPLDQNGSIIARIRQFLLVAT